MYKITNIETLGTDYTVANQDGKILKNIRIIPHTEILEAALGPYTEEFGDISSYMDKSIAVLEGNEDLSPYRVYWYAYEDESEVILTELIEYAVKQGYDTIILEQLDIIDPSHG